MIQDRIGDPFSAEDQKRIAIQNTILLKQLVVSSMEYCSPLWTPTERAKIDKLESVQRFFTRHINGMNGPRRPSYEERLKRLGIYSLERRRERYLLIYMFKVLNNLVPNPGFSWDYNCRTGFRIHLRQAVKGACAKVKRLVNNSTINKAAALFNKLPVDFKLQSDGNLETYKKRLDKLLTAVPDQPDSFGRAASSNSLEQQLQYRVEN